MSPHVSPCLLSAVSSGSRTALTGWSVWRQSHWLPRPPRQSADVPSALPFLPLTGEHTHSSDPEPLFLRPRSPPQSHSGEDPGCLVGVTPSASSVASCGPSLPAEGFTLMHLNVHVTDPPCTKSFQRSHLTLHSYFLLTLSLHVTVTSVSRRRPQHWLSSLGFLHRPLLWEPLPSHTWSPTDSLGLSW